jgi:hypothetical protein
MKNKKEEYEPIIWTEEDGSLTEFFRVANRLGMTHIIYVHDFDGNDESLWATSEKDLISCINTYTKKKYLGTVTSILEGFNRYLLGIELPINPN